MFEFYLAPFLKGDVLKMDRECHLFLNQFSITEAIKPNNWGPQCWGFLDHVAFSFPIAPNATEQQHVYDYFHSLKNVRREATYNLKNANIFSGSSLCHV